MVIGDHLFVNQSVQISDRPPKTIDTISISSCFELMEKSFKELIRLLLGDSPKTTIAGLIGTVSAFIMDNQDLFYGENQGIPMIVRLARFAPKISFLAVARLAADGGN